MSITAISQANGADLLNLFSQATGQTPTATAVTASVEVLKKALAQAQLCESQLLSGTSDTGSQLNLFA